MPASPELLEILMRFNQDPPPYVLCLDGDTFPITCVCITNSPTPVNEPTVRGGAYFAEKFAYKMSGVIEDLDVVPLLTKKMLGPNTEFAELEITTQIRDNDCPLKIRILTNLTNSVQRHDSVELGMIIVGLESV